MSFNEKATLIALGSMLGFMSSLISNIIFSKINKLKLKKKQQGFLKSLTAEAIPAIVNGDHSSISDYVSEIKMNYNLLTKEEKLHFQQIDAIYITIQNNGYTDNGEKKAHDIEKIMKLKTKYYQ